MVGLGNLIETSATVANASSRYGQVVVGTNEFSAPGPIGFIQSAFRWTKDTGMVDLGSLRPGGNSLGKDVTRDGIMIVGTSDSAPDPHNPFVVTGLSAEPFLWTEANGMVGLGHLPYEPTDVPYAYQHTTGTAISGDGVAVVGTSRMVFRDQPHDLYRQAFIWTEEDGMTSLGFLPFADAFILSEYDAVDVSNRGKVVVGNVTLGGDGGDSMPFIWNEEDGMQLLAHVLVDDFGLPLDLYGWDLETVAAISDDGLTIVGTGLNPDGEQEAWRVVMEGKALSSSGSFFGVNADLTGRGSVLVPEPTSAGLVWASLVMLFGWVRRNKLNEV